MNKYYKTIATALMFLAFIVYLGGDTLIDRSIPLDLKVLEAKLTLLMFAGALLICSVVVFFEGRLAGYNNAIKILESKLNAILRTMVEEDENDTD
jgi:hypothetical protein